MWRLLLLIVGAFALVAAWSGSDQRAGAIDVESDCLGHLRSAIARGALGGRRLRDEQTGEPIAFPAHFTGDFNPGLFHGTSGAENFLAYIQIDQSYLDRYGCTLPLRDVLGCVDFSADDPCGDLDGDGYWNQLETTVGSDPADAASTPEYGLFDEQSGVQWCQDRVDNDLDGRVDGGDPGCRVTCLDFGLGDLCRDRDRDGWVGHREEQYGSDPDNGLSTPEGWAINGTCVDGTDNDLDGLADAADENCQPF